jgi:hypothetical protein
LLFIDTMLAKLATLLGLVMVLGAVFACGPKSQNAAIQTVNVLLCYPETLEGGTLAEKGYGEPTGPDGDGAAAETVPEELLGPDSFAASGPAD